MKRLLWFVVIVSVFVGSWFMGDVLRHQGDNIFRPMTVATCPSSVNCEAIFSDQTLKLQLSPTPVVMAPFIALVETGEDIAEIYLQFQMKDMDMGVQRYRLLGDGHGQWQSEVMLPVCSLGRSDWVAILDVKYREEWWRGEFPFEAGSN